MPKTTPYTQTRKGFLEVRVPYKDHLTGKWKSKVKRVANAAEARSVAARLKAELDARTPQQSAGDALTFARLMHLYTRPMPEFYRKLFIEHFGPMPLRDITPEHLVAFRRQREATPHRYNAQQPRSAATINREMQALNRPFQFAKKRGWIQANPFDLADGLIVTSGEEARTRLPSDEEIESLLAHATGERAHLKPIILVALDTGLRKGKILSLQWSQIDFDTGLITLGRVAHKNKRHPPVVAMTPRLRAALLEWKAQARDEAVFGQKDLKRAWHTLCRKAKVRDLHFHDLRHKYATAAILAGLPRDIVMKQTGHSTDVFDRYLNLDAEIARRTAEALARGHKSESQNAPQIESESEKNS
jgi:integrase